MTVKSAQTWSGLVVCTDATGALASPSAGPAGALYVDGTVNAAAVTISGSNPYKWTVTLPSLTAGQCVSMYITATIATIATASVVAEDVADTYVASDVQAIVGHTDYGNAKLVRSSVPANSLDVSSTGEAGVDLANIKQATAPTTLTNITIPTVTTTGTASAVTAISTGGIVAGSFAAGAIDAAAIADNAIDAGAIATGAITSAKFAAGAIDAAAIAANAIGASELAADAVTEIVAGMTGLDIFIYTLTDSGGNVIEDCLVQAYSDEAMTTIVDYGVTDLYGMVRLNLDAPGTYYLKRTKTGYTFTNPDTETLS